MLAESSVRGDAAYKRYKTADYSTAKAAVLHFIEIDKEFLAASSTERRTYAADLTIWYVRLAKLEEQHGGPDKDTYMTQAASYCEQVHWKNDDCSAQTMRKAVDVMDQVPVK